MFDGNPKDKGLNSDKESNLSAVKKFKNTIVSLSPSHKNLVCTFKLGNIFYELFHVVKRNFTNCLFFDQMTANHTVNVNSILLLLNVFHGSGFVVISTVLEATVIAQ